MCQFFKLTAKNRVRHLFFFFYLLSQNDRQRISLAQPLVNAQVESIYQSGGIRRLFGFSRILVRVIIIKYGIQMYSTLLRQKLLIIVFPS